MDMTGEYRIAAPREQVWQALNDPEILRQAIPGCERVDRLSDTEMEAAVTAKVGPVKARFTGRVTLTNLNPPESYTISGQGTGGPAGFAKGGADVHLVEEDGATRMSYVVRASIGGKLAQLGSRLIDSTAKKMADDFFQRFSALVEGRATEVAVAPPPTTPEPVAGLAPPEDLPATSPPPGTPAATVTAGAPEPVPEPAIRVAVGQGAAAPPPLPEMGMAAEMATEARGQGSPPGEATPAATEAGPSPEPAAEPVRPAAPPPVNVSPPAPPPLHASPADGPAAPREGLGPAIWIGGVVLLVIVLLILFGLG